MLLIMSCLKCLTLQTTRCRYRLLHMPRHHICVMHQLLWSAGLASREVQAVLVGRMRAGRQVHSQLMDCRRQHTAKINYLCCVLLEPTSAGVVQEQPPLVVECHLAVMHVVDEPRRSTSLPLHVCRDIKQKGMGTLPNFLALAAVRVRLHWCNRHAY